ncbi:T9SS type B sorting domain-containing protein [Flavobacterium sp.]|jgi:gliding motility-associated-like protein|uniref:T9SS type B sorting domain-containing protein n=1 Tax=Flavobacterium sp. TaxID=239 RepID=UPI0037BFEF5C
MINTIRFFFFLTFASITQIYSQSSCPNSDFESGTLGGWQGQTGSCCPIVTSPSGIVAGRHTIMTGTGTDPNTCDVVRVVSPGGLFSARVGNDQAGAQAETLSYIITVTPSSSLFIYKYAVVLEDPGHDPTEQPRFQVRVLNAAGQLIDPTCGQYTVVAGVGLAGFQTCNAASGEVRYRDWTTVGLNLSAYLGQNVTIEFETGDCSPGAHFGYAYVDAYCSPLQIGATFCTGSFAAQLTAPIGFSYLWNTGETTQTILVNSPAAGLNYSCTLTSVTGCTVVISTVLQLEDPTADFTITNTCFNNAIFEDTTVLTNTSLLDSYLWDFGDGTTSTLQNPTHSFPGTGTYTVKFTTFNAFGCSTSATKIITVYSAPTAQITYGQNNFCTSDTALKSIQLTGTDLYTGGVYSIDVPGLSFNPSTAEFTPSTSAPGTYVITYTIPTTNGCTVPPVTTTITLFLAPQATINYGATSYCNLINWSQNVSLNGIGVITGGTYTATPAGLAIDPTSGFITPSASLGGNYTITYTVPPSGGVCSSITATTTVTIITAPTAIIRYATPYCDSVTTSQAVTLTGTGIFGVGFYGSFPSGLQLNTTTGDIIPSLSTPGNYTVEYTIPAAGGCSAVTVSTTVSITPLPTAAISYADPFCRSITTPEPVLLTGTAAYTGGVFTAPSGVTVNSATGGITPSNSIAGTHQIVYAIPATLGCTPASVNTTVTILPLPEPVLTNFSICEDPRGYVFRPALLDTTLSDLLYSCQWFFNGAPIPGVTSNQYTASAPGNYSVLVTNIATGCVSPQATSSVSTAVTVEDFSTYVTNTFVDNNTLTVLVSGGTGPYLFSIDGLPFQVSNVFTQLTPGIHIVKITDVNNCTDVSKAVMVLGYPNYFTPNGDGINDYWNIYYFDAQPNAKIYIYDRHGKLLKQLSPLSKGWDGTYNGNLMPSTDYWFLVEFKDFDENGVLVWQTFKAHFSMRR